MDSVRKRPTGSSSRARTDGSVLQDSRDWVDLVCSSPLAWREGRENPEQVCTVLSLLLLGQDY